VYYSTEYLKSYECKLLGLSDKVNLYQPIDNISDVQNEISSSDNMNQNDTFKNVYVDLNDYILMVCYQIFF
jgi:hypothetical protein